jgi:hypothetical protein
MRAMGKFKIHLKLQGLELDIEGDRLFVVSKCNLWGLKAAP